jgi:hypothetical protein
VETYHQSGSASGSLARHNAGIVWENESNENLNGEVTLRTVHGSRYKHYTGRIVTDAGSNGATMCATDVSGVIKTTSAITHVKFAASSGNITSGTIRMYGYAV